jgi:hypothetical protein
MKEIENERLLYQANKIPAGLALLFLLLNTWQTIFTLNSIDVTAAGIRVMEIILTNIVLSFFVFIASFEIKRYSIRWSWAALVMGIFQCLRIFIAPVGVRPINFNIVFPLITAGLIMIIVSLLSLSKCHKYYTAKKEQEKNLKSNVLGVQ